MPDWLEQRRLDACEAHVQEVVSVTTEQSPPMSVLNEVFEFGRLNLYAAFQAQKTANEFGTLIVRLSEHGLMVDEHQSVSAW
jgi:hypothetical protein